MVAATITGTELSATDSEDMFRKDYFIHYYIFKLFLLSRLNLGNLGNLASGTVLSGAKFQVGEDKDTVF